MITMNEQIESDLSKILQKLNEIEMAQNQQKLLEFTEKVNRLWMAFIKFVKSQISNSALGPPEFWQKRLELFCSSPSLDPIAMLEAISSELLGCTPKFFVLQVPDNSFVSWRISVIKIIEQVS